MEVWSGSVNRTRLGLSWNWFGLVQLIEPKLNWFGSINRTGLVRVKPNQFGSVNRTGLVRVKPNRFGSS
jgi:hypothetical protein